MKVHWPRFNIIFGLAVALVALCGCKIPDSQHKSARSTLRFYLEASNDPMGVKSDTITLLKDPLVTLRVEKSYFLSESNVKDAKIVEIVGGFALSIQFDREGTLTAEQYTSAARGKRVAIFSQFVEPNQKTLNEGRWIAAVKITNRITDGLVVFAPNTTREEAEQIVAGLKYVAKKTQVAE